MGNEGAAILVGASIAAVALATDLLAEKPALHAAARRFGMPAVGLVVLVTSAAPFAGANAGVAVWGVIAYGIAWAAMNGVRLTWRTVGLTVLAVVLAVAAFAALDLMLSSGGGSHLARFARGILGGDVTATTELVRRKLANNLAYLPQTNYTGLAIAMAASLALLWFAPSRPLRRALSALTRVRGGVARLGRRCARRVGDRRLGGRHARADAVRRGLARVAARAGERPRDSDAAPARRFRGNHLLTLT